MGRRWLLFGVCLLAFSTAMWGQLPVVPGTDKPEHPQHTHRHDRRVNFGIKGGFTSSLFLVSDLVLNGTVIDEVQNNYKIGYFGSFFMRINFKRHFLQPELSYTINRCNITFEKPLPEDAPESSIPEMASITSSIHIYIFSLRKDRKLKTKSHPQEAKSPAGTKAYCRFVCLMLLLDLAADTFCQMVVDKACCLQMRVANRAPEELESPFFHVLAHGIGLGR